jgi:hypothetical protein
LGSGGPEIGPYRREIAGDQSVVGRIIGRRRPQKSDLLQVDERAAQTESANQLVQLPPDGGLADTGGAAQPEQRTAGRGRS